MLIQCTRKLLDKLKVKSEEIIDENHEEHEMLTEWGADMGYGEYNLIIISWGLERI